MVTQEMSDTRACVWRICAVTGCGGTASRSVVGIVNEFTYLADAWRQDEPDLLALAMRLAATPSGPLYKRHISPDRELAALVAAQPHAQR
jgi:Domain of unknown function (DUF6933)